MFTHALRLNPFLIMLLFAFGILAGCQPEAPEGPSDQATGEIDPTVVPRDTLVVTGTLIDATCHAMSAAHADTSSSDEPSALECEGDFVAQGYPVALRTDIGEAVWILVTVPQALIDYLTSTVRVTGIVRSQGVLIPEQMEVRTGAEWIAIM